MDRAIGARIPARHDPVGIDRGDVAAALRPHDDEVTTRVDGVSEDGQCAHRSRRVRVPTCRASRRRVDRCETMPGLAADVQKIAAGVDDAGARRERVHVAVGAGVPGGSLAADDIDRGDPRSRRPFRSDQRECPARVDRSAVHRQHPHFAVRIRVPRGHRSARDIQGREVRASLAADVRERPGHVQSPAAHGQRVDRSVRIRKPERHRAVGQDVREVRMRRLGDMGEPSAHVPAAGPIGHDRRQFSRDHRDRLRLTRRGVEREAAPRAGADPGELAADVDPSRRLDDGVDGSVGDEEVAMHRLGARDGREYGEAEDDSCGSGDSKRTTNFPKMSCALCERLRSRSDVPRGRHRSSGLRSVQRPVAARDRNHVRAE